MPGLEELPPTFPARLLLQNMSRTWFEIQEACVKTFVSRISFPHLGSLASFPAAKRWCLLEMWEVAGEVVEGSRKEEKKFSWGFTLSRSAFWAVFEFASGSSHPPKSKTCSWPFHYANAIAPAARQQTLSKNRSGWHSSCPTTATWLNSKNWQLD